MSTIERIKALLREAAGLLDQVDAPQPAAAPAPADAAVLSPAPSADNNATAVIPADNVAHDELRALCEELATQAPGKQREYEILDALANAVPALLDRIEALTSRAGCQTHGKARVAVYVDCPYPSQAQRVYICQTCNSVIDPVEVRDE